MHPVRHLAKRQAGTGRAAARIAGRLREGCRSPFSALLIALALMVPATADAHDPALVSMLSSFDGGPPDAALDRFEPGLETKLIGIVEDAEVRRLARQRAVAALARYPDSDRAFELLALVVREEGPVLRLTALGTLGKAFDERTETLSILEATLSDDDPGLRARAVRVISHIGGPRAEELLSRQRILERHVVVRRALRQALEKRSHRPLPREGRVLEHRARGLEDRAGPTEGGAARKIDEEGEDR